MKQRVGQLLMQDPFASPKVVELNQQLQKAQQTIQQQTNTITQLRIMASQRMERQAEWVASQERIKRFEIMFKQWQQENKDTQEARMEVLRKLLDNGDTFGAMAMLQAIRQIDNPVLTEPETQIQMNDATADTLGQFTENNQEVFNNVANPYPNGNQQVPAGPTGPGPGNPAGTNFGQLPTGFPTNGQQPFVAQPFRR
jgi:hypothetical protein